MTDVLVDWVSFTVKPTPLEKDSLMREWQEKLGEDWEEGRGGNGYPVGFRSGGITILTGSRDEMGIHIQIPGAACRDLEAQGRISDWYTDLLRPLLKRSSSGGKALGSFSRFDVALDDFDGVIHVSDLIDAYREQRIVSRFRHAEPSEGRNLQSGELTNHGLSLGRRGSDSFVRAYDKKLEQSQLVDVEGYEKQVEALHEHWVRVEMQLRNERAQALVEGLCDGSASVPGLLRSYVDVKGAKRDVQRDRWDTDPAWESFLEGVPARRLSLAPKPASTIQSTWAYLNNQAAPALAACVDALGPDAVAQLIQNGQGRQSDRHRDMVTNYARLTSVARGASSQGGQD